MSVRISMATYSGGGAVQPEVYDATNYATVANAVAAIASGFLTITRQTADPAGGAGTTQNMALSVAQIKLIEQI